MTSLVGNNGVLVAAAGIGGLILSLAGISIIKEKNVTFRESLNSSYSSPRSSMYSNDSSYYSATSEPTYQTTGGRQTRKIRRKK